MNDFPTVTPASVPPAQPRSRRAGRRIPAPRRKRRKKHRGMTWWQVAVLIILFGMVLYAAVQWAQANRALQDLRQERQAARERYEQTVRNHQVKYRDLIERYSAEYDLNPAFVSAIIMNESGYDPYAVSRKDAMGLMQFMPSTFEWVRNNTGYRGADISILYEPEAAIKMGCYLIRYIINDLGSDDPILVACGYHAGWRNVRESWIPNYSTDGKTLTIDQIPMSDTRTYAGRVLNSYAIYLQHYY